MTTKIKYDIELMGLMSIFERITGCSVKDCFIDKNSLLTFMVDENDLGKAVGKKASKVKLLENTFKRKLKIVGFSKELLKFVQNLIFPLKALEITEEGQIVFIKGADVKTKSLLIGRNAQNLRNLENIVKRYFTIEEIKVV